MAYENKTSEKEKEARYNSVKQYIDSKMSTFRHDSQRAFNEAVYSPNATQTEKTVVHSSHEKNEDDSEPN